MIIKRIAKFALTVILSGSFTFIHAQTNHPFSWKVTTDPWYLSPEYSFKYLPNEFTANGKSITGHGPVCTNACKETTNPGVCTEYLMKEKFGEVEMPNFHFPKGYSGVEYVTFVVQRNGKVNGYQVVKQPVLCPPCIQTAVNLVASLDEWYPAIQDGIFVESRVVVPVYFKTGHTNR
ncbi:MAG: hypothetical protein ACE5FF_14360 [Saprospiraceae bacterium]